MEGEERVRTGGPAVGARQYLPPPSTRARPTHRVTRWWWFVADAIQRSAYGCLRTPSSREVGRGRLVADALGVAHWVVTPNTAPLPAVAVVWAAPHSPNTRHLTSSACVHTIVC